MSNLSLRRFLIDVLGVFILFYLFFYLFLFYCFLFVFLDVFSISVTDAFKDHININLYIRLINIQLICALLFMFEKLWKSYANFDHCIAQRPVCSVSVQCYGPLCTDIYLL